MQNAYNNYDLPIQDDSLLSGTLLHHESDAQQEIAIPMSRHSGVFERENRYGAADRHVHNAHTPEYRESAAEAFRPTENASSKQRILVLCDDFVGRSTLREFLEKEGFDVSESMFAECMSDDNHERYAAVLVDMGSCQLSTASLRNFLQECFAGIPVIIVDEPHQNAERTCLLREFAFSYVLRPCNRKDLLSRIEYAVKFTDLLKENRSLRQSIGMPTFCSELYGTSPLCESRRRQISAFARLGRSVLLCGEHGSGKLLTAQQIHLAGPRADHPFQAVDCESLTPVILDALLFGYTKGTQAGLYGERAGLFELVNGGTLYLGQITALPLSIQEKLSRYLKDGYYIRNGAKQPTRVDVQIIAGATQNLSVACLTNSFLEDLYYQLSTQTIQLPNLKDLTEDIPAFTRTLMTQYARFTGGQVLMVSNEALAKLQRHTWPGNFREYYDVVYRACLRAKNSVISEKDIVFDGPAVLWDRGSEYLGLAGMSIAEVERRLIIETLAANGGNRSMSARQLGVSEKTIYNKSKQYKLNGRF